MNIAAEISSLELPPRSYMIVGSGILNALGIRESNDIDLLVSGSVFLTLQEQGWQIESRGDDTFKATSGSFDCMTDWYGQDVATMLENAQYIEDIPYMSLEDVYNWKQKLQRPKDILDLKLIENYTKEQGILLPA